MSDAKNPFVDYQDRPLTDAEKVWLHEWSRDDLVEINERIFAQSDAHDKGEPIDVKGALEKAGVKQPDAPPTPTYVGAQGGVQQGPLIVEGKDNAGRVSLPRDHPLTGVVDEDASGTSEAEKWDDRKVRAEVNELNVDELKENLRDLDESVSGNKDELRARLFEALKKQNG